MAEHMAMSSRTAARVTTMAEVDMAEMVKLRQALKEKFQKDYGINLTFVPFVMKAMAEGAKEFPILNASLRGEEVVFHGAVNIGVAVDTGESLLVPVVKEVAKKSIVDLSREVGQLSVKARGGVAGRSVLRRLKVAVMASARIPPSKSKLRAMM